MEKETVKFKISPNWDCIKSLEELINDAKFIFQNDGHKGRRPRIVLNTPINECDVIELDYDRFGLITNATAKFNEQWGKSITDSSKDIRGFIEDFLTSENCSDFIISKSLDEAVEKTIEAIRVVSPSEDKTAEPLTKQEPEKCNGNCGMNYCDENGCIERKRNLTTDDISEFGKQLLFSTPVIEQKEEENKKLWERLAIETEFAEKIIAGKDREIDFLKKELAESKQLTPNDGWISVKDRLPKPGQRVLGVNSVNGNPYDPFTTYYSDGFKCFIVYKNDNNGDGDYGITADVTHWMPLPKSPIK